MEDDVAEAGSEGRATGTHAGHSHVFISYASQDTAIAETIVESLEQHGIRCWMAPRDVRPGTVYADAIVGAINDARAVILVLSGSAVASSHVGKEIERASSKHKQIIAFRIDGALLNRALEYFLSESQWIDAHALGMRAAIAKLIDAAGSPSTIPAPPPPAAKPRIAQKWVAIAVICFGAAAIAGIHFWPSGRGASPPSSSVTTDKSIAVLPFVDMSEKKDQEYFADGMAEEIIDLLAKLPGIRVIGRTSSFQFKGKSEDLRKIGAILGAAYVVEGSVRKSGDRLRITAQLIGTNEGSHLWSETYEEDVGDVLKVQDRIASALVRALQVSVGAADLRSRPALKSPEAYDLVLRGRHAFDRFDKDGLETAAEYFQQALKLDPTSVSAAEWLAATDEWIAEYGFAPPREGFERARAAAQQVLQLDPRSAAAHSLLCSIHVVYDWDWVAADLEHKLAMELDPHSNFAAADLDRALGHWDEAERILNSAFADDPLFAAYHGILGVIRYRTGRLSEAETEMRKALAISPTYHRGHRRLGQILLAEGRLDEALAEMQRETDDGGRDMGLSLVYYAMKRGADADTSLRRLAKERASDRAYQIAEVHAYRGSLNEAFEWLDRAFIQKDVELFWILNDPLLRNLESDSRYKTFLRKMNLPT
jgi:TolB-like protein/Tfp pilus assembly protein PilF